MLSFNLNIILKFFNSLLFMWKFNFSLVNNDRNHIKYDKNNDRYFLYGKNPYTRVDILQLAVL